LALLLFFYTFAAKFRFMAKKKLQHRYLEGFGFIVILLALVRWGFPEVATSQQLPVAVGHVEPVTVDDASQSPFTKSNEQQVHPIFSVPNYKEAFPDTNDLQLTAAQRWGVLPVKNRQDAENRRNELVYIGASPYYHVDPLRQSIPYLVPRAAILLQDIGRAFFDSLQLKGVPLHRFRVTSVLRTQDDVTRLRQFNGNATENSCHLYGTTFDIAYNRYETVEDPKGVLRRKVQNDTLKWVLCEVLRDMRREQRCYVKYEVKQGCFHMTVR